MAWLTELMHQVLYRRSSRLVTLSRYSRNALPTSPRTKAAIIPHPAFEHYRSKAPITTRDRPVALFFGRITAYKGLNNFCDAAALLLAEGIEADFVIAGQGNIEACLQKGVPPGVAVINRFLEEKEVSKLLASASVLVLPYTDATQSGVLAAAYAAGLPVVATTVGSFPEFVREGVSGLLVPPHQPRALAEAMRRVLTNRVLRQELSRGAEDIARNELNWTIITERHLELYRAIVYPACNQPAPR
jgi:glycosyltransferase involved in cell wall biosynthesis